MTISFVRDSATSSRRRSIKSSTVNPAAPARAANSPAIWPSCRSRSAAFFSGFLFADESSRALVSFEHAAEFEFAVGAHDGIGIDCEIDGELAHRGQLVAGGERAGSDAAADLIDELAVDRYAAVQVEREAEARACWDLLPMCVSVLYY